VYFRTLPQFCPELKCSKLCQTNDALICFGAQMPDRYIWANMIIQSNIWQNVWDDDTCFLVLQAADLILKDDWTNKDILAYIKWGGVLKCTFFNQSICWNNKIYKFKQCKISISYYRILFNNYLLGEYPQNSLNLGKIFEGYQSPHLILAPTEQFLDTMELKNAPKILASLRSPFRILTFQFLIDENGQIIWNTLITNQYAKIF